MTTQSNLKIVKIIRFINLTFIGLISLCALSSLVQAENYLLENITTEIAANSCPIEARFSNPYFEIPAKRFPRPRSAP